MKKNTELVVNIVDTTPQGVGISKVGDEVIFVENAVEGDKVKIIIIKEYKNYSIGKIIEIIEKSKYRTEKRCKASDKCGGCSLLHVDYNEQLRIKEKSIKDNFKKIGNILLNELDDVWDGILGMEKPFHYRNKTIYPVSRDENGNVVIGFYKKKSHKIIECDNCVIGDKDDKFYKEIIKQWMKEYGITPYKEIDHSGLLRHIIIRHTNNTDQACLILVVNLKNSDKLKGLDYLVDMLLSNKNIKKKLKCVFISRNTTRSNVILVNKSECIWCEKEEYKSGIKDRIGDVKYIISPNSFYQINRVQTKVLYDVIREYLKMLKPGGRKLWDLYCGIGTIGLYCADIVNSVHGVEVVEDAIKDANENAKINSIQNATYVTGDIINPRENIRIDVDDIVIVDPPRKGLSKAIKQNILDNKPFGLIYISCNSATLARDIKDLKECYSIKKMTAVDMFPMTGHVECVVLMSRVK